MADKRPAPATPGVITRLPEDVVNRIAAGEVSFCQRGLYKAYRAQKRCTHHDRALQIIQRPSNALKELIENSLDAKATTIRITVKEGGIKMLQIQDNGSGIRKGDLPILCERFTTSKIKAFDDLCSLGTYGFRGEALASISHVAHLTVTTKTKEDSCAWKASYSDGKMIPVKSGSTDPSPVPCAGNDGTVLLVEDLFFNTPQRLKSLKSAGDEYGRIVNVVLAYSIHNAGVAMSCKRVSSAASNTTADINTSVGASVLDNIGVHYGDTVKRELVEISAEDKQLGVKAHAWCSGANYQAKKGTYLFFINHRYVDCTPLKRALEAFYATLLAKGTYPFIYLSLEIDPAKIDVNVHPTKKEVGFEDEDEVVELVCEKLAEVLEKQGESRSYKVQTLLPGTKTPKTAPRAKSDTATISETPSQSTSRKPSTSSSSTKPAKLAANKLVRTDAQSQTLDALFPTILAPASSRSRKGKEKEISTLDDDEDTQGDRPSKRRKSDHDPEFARLLVEEEMKQKASRVRLAQSDCALTSVRQLRQEVLHERNEALDTLFKNHSFVGVADLDHSVTLIQHQTKLYLINHTAIAEELFYQLGLRQFGRLSRIKLKPPPDLKQLIRLAIERDAGRSAAKLSIDQIVDPPPTKELRHRRCLVRIFTTLCDARAMLDEYFSFEISDSGALSSLPLVLPGHSPDLQKLPLFLFRIGAHVTWTSEKACFTSFLRELAYFYSPATASPFSALSEDAQKRLIQYTILPAAKQYLVPPSRLLERDVTLATSLEALFRVFERC
ncbi:SPOSA6832_00914, partial [Sporobolomyces salmonicolor]